MTPALYYCPKYPNKAITYKIYSSQPAPIHYLKCTFREIDNIVAKVCSILLPQILSPSSNLAVLRFNPINIKRAS